MKKHKLTAACLAAVMTMLSLNVTPGVAGEDQPNSKEARITFLNAETGELLRVPEDFRIIALTPIIGYHTAGSEECTYVELGTAYTDQNPCFWDISHMSFAEEVLVDIPADGMPFGFMRTEGDREITVYDNGGVDIVFRLMPSANGDADGDGTFGVTDVVILQKWLLGLPDAGLANWKAVDFCKDDVLDIYDLSLMKQALIRRTDTPVAVTMTKTGGIAGVFQQWRVYEEDGAYYISYTGKGDPAAAPDRVTAITEEQYRAIMAFNYEPYLLTPAQEPMYTDAFYYTTEITYTSGAVRSTQNEIRELYSTLSQLDKGSYTWD